MPTVPLLLVDTGADETLLHFRWAKLMGYEEPDLMAEESKAASGTMIVHRPKDLKRVELEIAGDWLSLPTLQFGKKLSISLLGRDMIFGHFELRMTGVDFELRRMRRGAP
jgi:hypothetical protein